MRTEEPLVAERVAWKPFRASFSRRWKPGEHVFVFGYTGSGKSELNRKLLQMAPSRNWLVIDAKGGDDPSLVIEGYEPIRTWPPGRIQPPPQVERAMSRFRRFIGLDKPNAPPPEEPAHYRLAPPLLRFEDINRQASVFDAALRDVFARRGSRVYSVLIDEGQIVAMPSPEGMGLGNRVGPILRQKRYHGCSLVLSTQYPIWIPKSTHGEARHRFVFRMLERDRTIGASEILGDRQAFVPLINGLREHEFLYQDAVSRKLAISKVEL